MNKLNKNSQFSIKCSAVIFAFTFISISAAESNKMDVNNRLSFEKAIKRAQQNDPWLTGNINKQRAIEAMSTAVNTLPDPKVSIGFANLPTNGFDFNQERMTQAKVGISQMFPRGDTLDIKSQQLKTESEAYPHQRKDRESKVAVTVGSLWLDAYRIAQSITLIEKNRSLFEQLTDVAMASYSSALGKTRQQDIVRAQLELTRLDDRLDKLSQQKSRYEGMLLQWLTALSINEDVVLDDSLYNIQFSHQLPQIDLLSHALVTNKSERNNKNLIKHLLNHPAVVAIDKQVSAVKTEIKLAQQKYKPEWGVNASYGYRGDDPIGRSRADLFSVGVTFDLPLFTENKQDKEVQSAVYKAEAIKTKKLLLLRQLLGSYSSAKGRLLRLKDRQTLYKLKLLPQIKEQVEASLTAYTHDDGDFSEVVRSRIALLNAEIDELTLNVEEQKMVLELNYLFVGSLNSSVVKNKINVGDSRQYSTIAGEKQ